MSSTSAIVHYKGIMFELFTVSVVISVYIFTFVQNVLGIKPLPPIILLLWKNGLGKKPNNLRVYKKLTGFSLYWQRGEGGRNMKYPVVLHSQTGNRAPFLHQPGYWYHQHQAALPTSASAVKIISPRHAQRTTSQVSEDSVKLTITLPITG